MDKQKTHRIITSVRQMNVRQLSVTERMFVCTRDGLISVYIFWSILLLGAVRSQVLQ